MSSLTRHVGRLKNTGTRVIVVFRELPDEPTSCLIIESDRLPDMYHDNIMKILNGREGQNTTDFYNVLARFNFSDGGNCLTTLHVKGLLKKVPVSMVEMVPFPNKTVPLEIINAEILSGKNQDGKLLSARDAIKVAENIPEITDDETKAKLMLEQAKKHDEEGVRLREEAYMLVPSLRPTRGRPSSTEAIKESARRLRNQRRRDKYQRQKAEGTI